MGDRRRAWRLVLATAAVVGAALVAPLEALAVTCDRSNALLTVTLPDGGDNAGLAVAANDEIVVTDGVAPVTCTGTAGAPTVNNIGAISVVGRPEGFTTARIREPQRFAPGATPQDGSDDDPGAVPEIEIVVNLDGLSTSLQVQTGDQSGNIVFGSGGINPNVAAEGPTAINPDADISFTGEPETLVGFGGASPDTFTAQGGQGTGGPLNQEILIDGKGGVDSIAGGNGGDQLSGGTGGDTLFGAGGSDRMKGDEDDDTLDGGDATDTVSYPFPGGATVDLSITTQRQDTGAGGRDQLMRIESVDGGPGPDVLRGNDEENSLQGFEGDDLLEGRGSPDELSAGDDADTVLARDGVRDGVDCGDEVDTAELDAVNVDLVAFCDIMIFPPTGDGAGQVQGAGAAGAAASPVVAADGTAPAFTGTPRAAPRVFEVDRAGAAEVPVRVTARKGTTFRYSLSEAATVTFAIDRRTRGRRVRGSCRNQTPANRRLRPCTLVRRVGAFRAQGTAGANSKRFSGRIGSRSLSPGSYRALVTATDAAGNRTRQATATFRVVAPRRRR
jgi:hypothetical protein